MAEGAKYPSLHEYDRDAPRKAPETEGVLMGQKEASGAMEEVMGLLREATDKASRFQDLAVQHRDLADRYTSAAIAWRAVADANVSGDVRG